MRYLEEIMLLVGMSFIGFGAITKMLSKPKLMLKYKYLRHATVILGILFILSAFVLNPNLLTQSDTNKKLYVVVSSSKDLNLSIDLAKRNRGLGYNAQVYKSNNGYYAVTLDHQTKSKALSIKKKALATGIAKQGVFLTGEKMELVFPKNQLNDFFTSEVTTNLVCFTDIKKANLLIASLEGKGVAFGSFMDNTRVCVFIFGNTGYSLGHKRNFKKLFTVTGNEILQRIFPSNDFSTSPRNNIYYGIKKFNDEIQAIKYCKILRKQGFEAEAYYTSKRKFIVSVASFDISIPPIE